MTQITRLKQQVNYEKLMAAVQVKRELLAPEMSFDDFCKSKEVHGKDTITAQRLYLLKTDPYIGSKTVRFLKKLWIEREEYEFVKESEKKAK